MMDKRRREGIAAREIARLEADLAVDALVWTGGSVCAAADLLGVNRRTLVKGRVHAGVEDVPPREGYRWRTQPEGAPWTTSRRGSSWPDAFDDGRGRGARDVLEELHRQAERMREAAKQAWRDNGHPEDMKHEHAVDTITRQLEALVSRGPWVEDGEGVK